MDIDGDCPFCDDHAKDINHLFKDYLITKEVWYNLIDVCPILVNNPMHFVYQTEWIGNHGKIYNSYIILLWKKLLLFSQAIWINRNKVIFDHYGTNSVHIINLATSCLNEMRYYNYMYSLYQYWTTGTYMKTMKQISQMSLTPPPNG